MKRILSVILVIIMLFISVPVTVWAEAMDKTEAMFGKTEEESFFDAEYIEEIASSAANERVYYSDLFYGYDTSYFRSEYIKEYARETYDVPFRIYNEYCEDPKFIATGMKLGAEAFGNPKTLVDSYNTFFGNYDVTYYDALDAANVKMFEAMFELDSSFYSGFGRTLMKNIKEFNAYVKGFRDGRYNDGSLDGLTDSEKFARILEDFHSKGIANEVEKHPFNIIVSTIGTDVDEYLKMASACVDILDLCQVVYTGMIMESVRLEVIDYIISKAPSNSELYDGMTRLKNQLRGGFATYFIDQYLVDKMLDKLADAVVKFALGSVSNTYSFYAAIVNILSSIIFDAIFDVPSLDDLVTQSVLTAYTDELYNIILNQYNGMYKETFGKSFTYDDIKTFEYIFEMNLAATNACLEATKGLVLDFNKDLLDECIEKYEYVSYDEYISDIKRTIRNTPITERKLKELITLTVNAETEIANASDELENGKLYMCMGRLHGAVNINAVFTVPEDINGVIDGSVTMSGYDNILVVDGSLEITGNINLNSSGSGQSKLIMTKPGSVLYLGGNFNCASFSGCNMTDGKIVFNGKAQQTVSNLKAQDIEVTNPKGIKYNSHTYLYGNYDLNGNSLDAGYYNTYWYNGATFTEGSDYKILYIPYNESVTLEGEVKANVTNYGILKIDEGKKAKIDGSISLTGGGCVIQTDGSLEITGDVNLKSSGSGNSKLTMTKPDSVLYIGGNFNCASFNCCSIADGKIVFNGKEQQKVSYLTAHDIEVTNPKGIKYNSHTYLYGNYDLNGNPLDAGYYNTYWYSGATFTEGSDYKILYIPYNESVTLEGEVKANVTNYGILKIDEGKKARIDGSISLAGGGCVIQTDGSLEITGDVNLKSSGSGNSKLTMTKPDSVLYLGGNFSSASLSCCDITDGKIVFNGKAQQKINYLRAKTVILENKSSDGVILSQVYVDTLFDHKGNNFTANYGCSFVDYDGDGIKDNYDPEPTVGPDTVPELSVDNYVVTITAASNIKDIRYALGEYTKGSEVKAAAGNVAINNALVVKYTLDGNFVYEMPTGGVYTFWVRTTDGKEYFLRADMTDFTPTVTTDGVKITIHDLYDVKDFYIAKGEYTTYREIKDNGYIVSISGAKIASNHDYTYTVYESGIHTVLIRYNDGTVTLFHKVLTVDEPVFTANGLQVNVSNLPDVKVIRTAYGTWNTVKELKATDTIRNFSAKTVIKGKDPYTIQYREEGSVTIIVEYNNGYQKVFHYDVRQKKPAMEQNGNSVTFAGLEGLNVLRYAKGEYSTVSQIKAAKGSRALKLSSMINGKITVDLDLGTYTFCVQYDDESYNYYIVTIG